MNQNSSRLDWPSVEVTSPALRPGRGGTGTLSHSTREDADEILQGLPLGERRLIKKAIDVEQFDPDNGVR